MNEWYDMCSKHLYFAAVEQCTYCRQMLIFKGKIYSRDVLATTFHMGLWGDIYDYTSVLKEYLNFCNNQYWWVRIIFISWRSWNVNKGQVLQFKKNCRPLLNESLPKHLQEIKCIYPSSIVHDTSVQSKNIFKGKPEKLLGKKTQLNRLCSLGL
jgi:hypothetical protein